MKKLITFLIFSLILCGCDNNRGKIEEELKERYDSREKVIVEIDKINKEEFNLQSAFEKDIEDSKEKELEAYISTFEKMYDDIKDSRDSYEKSLNVDKEKLDELEEEEKDIFYKIDSLEKEILEEFKNVDSFYDEKISLLSKLSNILQTKNPKEVEVAKLVKEINVLDKKENDQYEKINSIINQIDKKNIEYEEYLKAEDK